MSSLEITKQTNVKKWWQSMLIVVAIFFVAQLVVGALLAYPLQLLFPGYVDILDALYSFAGSLLLLLVVNKRYHKSSMRALGFHKTAWLKKYFQGVLFAFVMLSCVVGVACLMGVVTFQLNGNVNVGLLLVIMLGFMIQGMTEEVLTRGYLQNNVAATKGFGFALFLQAIVFTAIHAANPGITLMPVVNLFVVAIMFGLLFWYTDSMWLVGGMHFAWNFILGPIIGIQVSGNVFPTTIFSPSVVGSELLTGGSFGIEGSILTTIFASVCSIVLYVLIKKKTK